MTRTQRQDAKRLQDIEDFQLTFFHRIQSAKVAGDTTEVNRLLALAEAQTHQRFKDLDR